MTGVPEGWQRAPTQAFGTHVGPFYRPADGRPGHIGFVADERHGNRRGVTHGGMLATAFDIALGSACWDAAGERPCATVHLALQYLGALKLGEFAVIRPEITRATSSLVFARGVMAVGDRPVATADGIWKILNWPGEVPTSGSPAPRSPQPPP